MSNVVMKNGVHDHEDEFESPAKYCPSSETA